MSLHVELDVLVLRLLSSFNFILLLGSRLRLSFLLFFLIFFALSSLIIFFRLFFFCRGRSALLDCDLFLYSPLFSKLSAQQTRDLMNIVANI